MGRLTVNQIMQSIAATVNQDATAPTAASAEWDLWLEFINRGVQEWAEVHDWEDLRKTYTPAITGMTQASVALPQDFKRLAAQPRQWGVGVDGGKAWSVIASDEVGLYDPDQEYIYVNGNISDGYSLTWNPGTLASGASITIPYFSIPTSLASPAQIPLIGDSQFLIDRTVAYVFEARSDARFQEMESKARDRLMNMIEQNDAVKFNSYAGRVPVRNTTRLMNWRIGRD